MWTQIYKNKEFIIYQDNTKFQISVNLNNIPLLNSVTKTKIINGSTITDNYKTIYFNAISVKSFETYQKDLYKINGSYKVPYDHALLILFYFGKQIEYLIKNENKCFYAYNLDNIIVVDDNKFLYLSDIYLADIENKKDLLISLPFEKEKNCFMCPEVKGIEEIPFELSFKTIYYSLCLLLIYALSYEMDFLEETGENRNNRINDLLKPIIDTKLYYTIKRGLIEDPKKRSILYI